MNELVEKDNTEINNITTPMDLLSMAMTKGADIDQLEKLMALQERWEAGEAKKAFVKAMSDFRSKCISIAKTREGHNCKYAGLAESIEQVSPTLVECGLSHRWETAQENNQVTVTCYLTHEMGHSESATMSSSPDSSGNKNDIQAIGSAMSYLQRYTFFAVTGLASREMDDDGNKAGVERITEDQALQIHAKITDNGLSMDKFMKYLRTLKCDSIEEISVQAFDAVMGTINNEIKKEKK